MPMCTPRPGEHEAALATIARQRYHVHVQLPAETYARIEAAFDEIGQRVAGKQLDANARIALQEVREARLDQQRCRQPRQVDAQQSLRLALPGAGLLDGAVEAVERRADVVEERLARFAQRDLPAGAVEQAHAETRFQAAHALRHRGNADAEPIGGAAEAAEPRRQAEYRQRVEGFGLLVPVFLHDE